MSRVVVDRYLILEVKPRQHKIYQDFWEISQHSILLSNIDAVSRKDMRILPADLHFPKMIELSVDIERGTVKSFSVYLTGKLLRS